MNVHLNVYIIMSTLVFMFLGMIWKTSDWVNLFLKFVFIIMVLFGIFMYLSTNGYIINVVEVQ